MKTLSFAVLCALSFSALASCVASHRVAVDPIQVEPIHLEVDVNLRDEPANAKPAADKRRR
jgi:hypothetical protein